MPALLVRPPDPGQVPPVLVLRAPPSKSLALRALMAAAVAGGGEVRWEGTTPDDVAVMVRALQDLATPLAVHAGGVRILGKPDPDAKSPVELNAAEGAAPARFLLALAATLRRPVTLQGAPGLARRPFWPLLQALAQLGASVAGGPHLPVTVQGPIRGGCELSVSAVLSSQFLSALLLVAPGLKGGLRLEIQGSLVSRPYLQLTREVMAHFGVRVPDDLHVEEDAAYQPTHIEVEPDWSGATVLLAAAAFLGRTVEVPRLDPHSSQPDRRLITVLGELGMEAWGDRQGVSTRGRVRDGGCFHLGDFPDSVPALACLAALAPSPVVIRGVPHLRLKESDRIAGLADLLRLVGARVAPLPDGLEVGGGWRGSSVEAPRLAPTRGDHRLAMAAALLGLHRPLLVDCPSCVSKSFPGFFEQWPGVALGES